MVGTSTTGGLNPAYLALSRFRRRRYEECIDICTQILADNPYDKAIWLLKCQASTASTFIDDSDLEEQGIADLLMDDNATAAIPRPGTSLTKPNTAMNGKNGGLDQAMRPMSNSGRPLSGFVRPSTQNSYRAPTSDSKGAVEQAMRKTGRPGTSRPVTSLGRHVRLGTASMRSEQDGPFIDVNRLDLRKYAHRPMLSKALCDFLLYHDHNPRKALELAAEATLANGYEDWWWKSRLGKCYYLLGLYRDAEQQFKSSLRMHASIDTYLDLGKVYLRLDQPQNALDIYGRGLEQYAESTPLLLAIARTYEMLQDSDNALANFKKVLKLDPSNIEATACLGAHFFYSDQPEIALRFYKRLLESTQKGIENYASAELWNNVGLCCFYASQYDMTLKCFENALAAADNTNMADIWYNLGIVATSVGDLGLAYQCFKVAVSIDPKHAEAFNNLGVLEIRKGNLKDASSDFASARSATEFSFEPYFNAALLAYKTGNFSLSYELVNKAHKKYPNHPDINELSVMLRQHLN